MLLMGLGLVFLRGLREPVVMSKYPTRVPATVPNQPALSTKRIPDYLWSLLSAHAPDGLPPRNLTPARTSHALASPLSPARTYKTAAPFPLASTARTSIASETPCPKTSDSSALRLRAEYSCYFCRQLGSIGVRPAPSGRTERLAALGANRTLVWRQFDGRCLRISAVIPPIP